MAGLSQINIPSLKKLYSGKVRDLYAPLDADGKARDDQVLLVISEKGFGKRTKAANFPSHKRGGVGIKAAIVTAKTGPIISVQTIEPNMNEAILVSRNGQTIRLGLDDIKLLGRTTQGVTIMRLSDGDAVSSIGLMEEAPQETEED